MLTKYLDLSKHTLICCRQCFQVRSYKTYLKRPTNWTHFKRSNEGTSRTHTEWVEIKRHTALAGGKLVGSSNRSNDVSLFLASLNKTTCSPQFAIYRSFATVSDKSQAKDPPITTDFKSSSEFKYIKVESFTEVRNTLQKFPNIKNILNNFSQVVTTELKDASLKIEPTFKCNQQKNGSPLWTCTYHLKWPEKVKIVAHDISKKRAASLAAAKVTEYLTEAGKLSPDGSPTIYSKADIRRLTNQKQQMMLNLDQSTIGNMENIVNIYQDKMQGVIEEEMSNCRLQVSNDLVIEEPGTVKFSKESVPEFLGTGKYLSREPIPLPISDYKDAFIDLLSKNKCVIVKGEPGCGKSSRVPQYVLESWVKEAAQDPFCRIAVTQPRRIAAISLSDRVSSEREEQLGHIVGYQVRLKSKFYHRTGRILYCTTGILLRHLQTDPKLTKFSHIILDEAHERDVNTDILMNLLKRALCENDKLKLIVMSATIDTEAFSEYYDGAPVFSVPGFTYPVQKYFLDQMEVDCAETIKMCKSNVPQVVHEEVVKVIKYIHNRKPEGAILVFLPGWEDISKIHRSIGPQRDMAVYMVHSKLKDSEQRNIFSKPPPGIRKVILATNIAETSITIDDVVYVVDTGVKKDKIFDVDRGVNVIDMEWISKASANQRAGRAGRCSPGQSYHLYTRERFEMMPDYSSPQILNSSLTKIILDSKVFTSNMNAEEFMDSLISPPEKSAVRKAVDELKQLALLDEHENLTPLGRTLVNFQLEPNLAKALFNGVVFKCVTPIVDIITLFSSDIDVFGSLSLTDKDFVKRVKSKYSKSSDHLAMMRLYEKWLEITEDGDKFAAQSFCNSAHLVPHKLEFIKKLEEIHLGYLYNGLYQSMPVSDDFSDNDELVKAVLYSGTGTILQHRNWDIVKNRLKTNANVLITRNNHKATITSQSVNYKRYKFPSDFLVYINETRSNVRRTTTVRECSLIPPISVLLFTNKQLEITQPDPKEVQEDNLVMLGIKGTKIKFLSDKKQAEVLIECKRAIDNSYEYLVHHLTYAGAKIPEFLESWNEILRNLDVVLSKYKTE